MWLQGVMVGSGKGISIVCLRKPTRGELYVMAVRCPVEEISFWWSVLLPLSRWCVWWRRRHICGAGRSWTDLQWWLHDEAVHSLCVLQVHHWQGGEDKGQHWEGYKVQDDDTQQRNGGRHRYSSITQYRAIGVGPAGPAGPAAKRTKVWCTNPPKINIASWTAIDVFMAESHFLTEEFWLMKAFSSLRAKRSHVFKFCKRGRLQDVQLLLFHPKIAPETISEGLNFPWWEEGGMPPDPPRGISVRTFLWCAYIPLPAGPNQNWFL